MTTETGSKRAQLAAVILTKNVAKHIVPCIETLRFADRIVVSDSYSTDGTVALATIGRRGRRCSGPSTTSRGSATRRWRPSTPSGSSSWMRTSGFPSRWRPRCGSVLARAEAGWWVPRHNFIVGHQVRHGGFYPDYQLRLLRRDAARYDPARPVHEVVHAGGRVRAI